MKKYSNFSTITDIFDNEMYIDDEIQKSMNSEIQKGMNDENSLKNISWIESVEQELSSSIDTKTFMCSSLNDKLNNNFMDVNNLIKLKYSDLCDLNIMEYQTSIINYLRRQLKTKENDKLNIDDLLLKLDWLLNTSKYLSDKIGLQTFQHKNNGDNMVSRSSYKFCDYNFECQFNYNLKKHCGCFAQHYVHNLVRADIEALKMYISNNKTNINENDYKIDEIRKSINTISFVIGHMYEELKNAQKFNFFNALNNHIERTPNKKKQTKPKLQIA